jgi:hypothetical protein
MEDDLNYGGSPKSSIFIDGMLKYQPSILGIPDFKKSPNMIS